MNGGDLFYNNNVIASGTGCKYVQSCYLNWTDEEMTYKVSSSTPVATTIYGQCTRSWAGNITSLGDFNITIEKGCPYGQSCDALWTDQSCGTKVGSSTPVVGEFYGACSVWSSFNKSAVCPTN